MEIVNTTFERFNAQQITSAQRRRFFLPVEDCADLIKPITMAYAACVRERRGETDNDADLNDRIAKVAKWLSLPYGRPGLLLYGNVGTGKTTMLNAVCRLVNYAVRPDTTELTMWDAPRNAIDIVRAKDIVEAYQNDRQTFNKYCKLQMLAIDEFGVEAIDVKSFGNSNEPIIDLLSTRYDRQRVTLISSNLDLDEIRNRYGLRLQDRFVEMFSMIGFNGKSYRR